MLSKVEALHTAARRYCNQRADLSFPGYDLERWDESLAESSARTRAMDVIGAAVEALKPAESASLEEAREHLLSAAASTVHELTQPSMHRVERRGIETEGRWFADYVRGLSDIDLAHVKPLLSRRWLSKSESARVWAELKTRWSADRGRMWYPWGDEPQAEAQVFDEDPFLDEGLQHHLREVLASVGVSRLWELRGFSSGPDYEIELAMLEPVASEFVGLAPGGREMFWSDATFDWLIYASHEDTVTIAGAELLSGLQAAWPAWRRFVPDWA
jgi:hypothetical protein